MAHHAFGDPCWTRAVQRILRLAMRCTIWIRKISRTGNCTTICRLSSREANDLQDRKSRSVCIGKVGEMMKVAGYIERKSMLYQTGVEYGDQQMSLDAIRRLNADSIKCCVLTKGLLPLELKDYSKENEYGITLISLNEEYREQVEPGAAPYEARLAALKDLHDAGCMTWVSIEPYPTPNLIQQDLGEILKSVSFVDKIIFGRTNYNKIVSEYKNNKQFYNECSENVISFCKESDINCHIKNRTQTKVKTS